MSLTDRNVNVFIDEWIWMVMSKATAEMVMRTRYYFFKMYHDLLKHCSELDMWLVLKDTSSLLSHIYS